MDCGNFLGFPHWYEYVKQPGTCDIKDNFELLGADTWLVGAAVLEILLRIAVFVSVIFVIYGGFRIISSGGTPEGVTVGRRAITQALVGFAISIMSIPVISYLANSLGANIIGADGIPVADPQSGFETMLGLTYRIAAGLTVVMVAISGFHFATASGDSQKFAKARSSIILAVIGLLITLLALTIVMAVGDRL